MRQSGTPMASRPSGSAVPAARPASGTAGDRPTLRIRNAARVPVDYVLEGPEPQGGRLAPGTEIPLPLPPGHYRLTLTDGGRAKPQDLVLRPGQDHSVVFP